MILDSALEKREVTQRLQRRVLCSPAIEKLEVWISTRRAYCGVVRLLISWTCRSAVAVPIVSVSGCEKLDVYLSACRAENYCWYSWSKLYVYLSPCSAENV